MKYRSVSSVVVLTIVTFGIYLLIWQYRTSKELRAAGVPTKAEPWLSLAPVLAMLLMIIPWALGKISLENTLINSLVGGFSGLLVIAIFVAAYIAYLFWQYDYARGIDKLTGGGLAWTTVILLYILSVIFVFPAFIYIGYIQHMFNQTIPSAAGSGSAGLIASRQEEDEWKTFKEAKL